MSVYLYSNLSCRVVKFLVGSQHCSTLNILRFLPAVGMTRFGLMLLFVIPTAGRNLKELTSITEPTFTNPDSNPSTPDLLH